MARIAPLAQDFISVVTSPEPHRVFCYTPAAIRLPDGALLVTMDYGGPGIPDYFPDQPFVRLAPRKDHFIGPGCILGRSLRSEDDGRTWDGSHFYPFCHARPFVAGGALYILGHCGDLMISRSDDMGRTWSPPRQLTRGQRWHQSACNVWLEGGRIYLVMEKVVYDDMTCWPVQAMAPVTLRARVTDDLTRPESWTFAQAPAFRDVVRGGDLDGFGVPFYPEGDRGVVEVAPGTFAPPMGWLESNIVRILDPGHYWYDPTGRTLHIFMRMHTGGTGYCAVMAVHENEDGSMDTRPVLAPSGKRHIFLPMPGGQMRFHMLYDEPSGLYWLLSTQAVDSMRRPECLTDGRYLGYNERSRMQLHFSRNCVDWCFAGIVAMGEREGCSRHYASMAVDGEDLLIASRTGDERAHSSHDTNIISLHRVRNFRSLVY